MITNLVVQSDVSIFHPIRQTMTSIMTYLSTLAAPDSAPTFPHVHLIVQTVLFGRPLADLLMDGSVTNDGPV